MCLICREENLEGRTVLECSCCPRLTSLPPLPPGLQALYCSFCPRLTSLISSPEAPLPPGLERLDCYSCPLLTSLLPLPPGLQALYCLSCPWLVHPRNPEFEHNIHLLRTLQRKLRTKLWKRNLIKRYNLKFFPKEIINLICSF